MKKVFVYTIMAVVFFGLCGIVAFNVQAKEGNGFYSSIIQKLVEKFNLNANEVQQVFDEAHEEMRQEMQNRFEERNGEMPEFTPPEFTQLTEEQKEALSAKREEMKEKFAELKDLTPEERQVRMEEIREEMKAWAEENGIDCNFLGMFGRGFGRGPGRGFGGEWKNQSEGSE